MEIHVVTIDESVYKLNGKKDQQVADLIEKIGEYGSIEPFAEYIKKHDEKWQKIVDVLKTEIDNVKAVACRDDFELAVLKACRIGVDNAVSAVNAEKERYRVELEGHKEKLEVLKANITAVLGE